MHRRNAAADDRAAQDCGPTPKIEQGHAKTRAGNQHGDEQRQDRQNEIVARANVGIIGEHRDEVSCPDATACRGCVQAQPNEPRAPSRCLGAVEQADSDRACQDADGDRKHNEAPVMVNRQAGVDSGTLRTISSSWSEFDYLP